MKLINKSIFAFMYFGLVACIDQPQSLEGSVSAQAQDISIAQGAVTSCSESITAPEILRGELERQGFELAPSQRGVNVFETSSGRVSVAISSYDALEKLCAINVNNLSPEQGISLIQPWVQLTNGVANAQLSRRAAAAWRGKKGDDIAFTAVILRSEIDEISGSWIRMIVIDR
jgi:hypothetical protein